MEPEFHYRVHNSLVLQGADGGDGLQIRRVAANILKQQWRTFDEECSSC